MPLIKATTKSSKETWKSPDGKITGFDIVLDVGGEDFPCNTFSKAIAEVGWSGEVETYERNNRTYVKQPPKEEGSYQSTTSGGSTRSSAGKPTFDNYTMYLSYGKDLAIACIKDGAFDGKLYAEVLSAVEAGGAQLYEGRPGGEKKEVSGEIVAEDIKSLFDE